MNRKVSLAIDEVLFRRLEQCAHKRSENVQQFLIKAVCDALDMWEDFYNPPQPAEKHPDVHFFINN